MITNAETIERHNQVSRELLSYAVVASDCPMERAAALITAATIVIEAEVGSAVAPAALLSLIMPTLEHWPVLTGELDGATARHVMSARARGWLAPA